MTSFKDTFYDRYTETHLLPRKGEASVEQFRNKSATWSRYFGRFLPPNRAAAVIDVGCGRGSMVWWLQHLGYRNAEGIDRSPQVVEAARALGVDNIRHGDLRDYLASNPDRFDVVFLRDVIEHFERPEIVNVMTLVRQALRPGGLVVLQVPNAESPFFGRVRYGDFTHELAFTVTSLAQLFNMLGFTDHEFLPVPPPFRGLRSAGRRLAWRVAEAIYKLLLAAELGRAPRIVTQNLIGAARRPA